MAFVPAAASALLPTHTTGDLWTYSNGVWSEASPSPSPSATTWYCFADDPVAQGAVFFGGGSGGGYLGGIGFADHARNATWIFENGGWQNLTATVGPIPAIKYPACAYDPGFDGGAIVLMGGANSSYEVDGTWLVNDTNATWALVRDSATGGLRWTELHPTRSPSARFGAAMAYDARTQQLVLYGGAENGTSTANGSCSPIECPHYHDTWIFSGDLDSNRWSPVAPNASPPGSVLTDMAYDPTDGYVVDFGGQDNGYKSPNATQNTTWAFNGTAWTNVTPAVSPSARFGAAMTFDNATGGVLMFGGLGGTVAGSPVRGDFWEFARGSWSRLGPSSAYPVTFLESGLPTGTTWNVTLTNRSSGVATERSNASDEIGFSVPSGTYEYSLGLVPGYHAPKPTMLFVSAAPVDVNVTFSPSKYEVRFTESGLDESWQIRWCITFNSRPTCGTGRSLEFHDVRNGSYPYSISPVTNYSLRIPYSGTVVVEGGSPGSISTVVQVPWRLVTYRVEFRETGLPAGVNWTVTFDGRTTTANTSSLAFTASNDSYRFTVMAEGYLASPDNGTILVNGSSEAERLTFTSSAVSIASDAALPGQKGVGPLMVARVAGSATLPGQASPARSVRPVP